MSKIPSPEELQKSVSFYATVGQGISNWARMERGIIHIAAFLLDSDNNKAGVVFYSVANFNTWLLIIDDLLALDKHLARVKREWNKLTSDLRKLNDIRVRLAHHTIWHGDPSRQPHPPEISLRPAREDRRTKSVALAPLTAGEIIAFTKATTQMSRELVGILSRLRTARMAL